MLQEPITPSDIFLTLKGMAKSKSPGPDGYTPEFFLSTWSITGSDFVKAITQFFDSLHLPRMVNATAIALIPENGSPSYFSQFHHISCRGLHMHCKIVVCHTYKGPSSAYISKSRYAQQIHWRPYITSSCPL